MSICKSGKEERETAISDARDVTEFMFELKKHCTSRAKLRHLEELNSVKELAKRVPPATPNSSIHHILCPCPTFTGARMLFGTDVLHKTLQGLNGPAVVPGNEEQSVHVLLHALMCESPNACGRPECTAEASGHHQTRALLQPTCCRPRNRIVPGQVATMKKFLTRFAEHVEGCSVANLPGSRGDCSSCTKWHQIQRLKERFTRKLWGQPSLADQKDALALLPGLIGGELEVHRVRRALLTSVPSSSAGASEASEKETAKSRGSAKELPGPSRKMSRVALLPETSVETGGTVRFDSRGNLVVCTLVDGCVWSQTYDPHTSSSSPPQLTTARLAPRVLASRRACMPHGSYI